MTKYLLAPATHPFFKLNWIEYDAAKIELVKRQMRNYMVEQTDSPLSDKSNISNDDFLSYPNSQQTTKPGQLEDFLKDPCTDMSMLDKYPQIKELFIKFNTTIPTSAPIERLYLVNLFLCLPFDEINFVIAY